jgi:hypothetical protein
MVPNFRQELVWAVRLGHKVVTASRRALPRSAHSTAAIEQRAGSARIR